MHLRAYSVDVCSVYAAHNCIAAGDDKAWRAVEVVLVLQVCSGRKKEKLWFAIFSTSAVDSKHSSQASK